MHRVCAVLRRTSRKGPGGWASNVNFASVAQIAPQSFPAPPRSSQTESITASHYDAADNAHRYLDETGNPYVHNWKSDPARRLGNGGPAETNATGSSARPTRGGVREESAQRKTGRPNPQAPRGDKPRTLTEFLVKAYHEAVERSGPDSRRYGDDGRLDRMIRQRDAKYADQRFTMKGSHAMVTNVLQSVELLYSPSGELCSADLLKGRLVGLLFFSGSERSRNFMLKLREFHTMHSPDFVVVAVSTFERELMHLTRSLGFYHCPEHHGGRKLMQCTNASQPPFIPMPRLFILDGASGDVVTRGGVTAVTMHPDTCFAQWRQHEPGFYWTDLVHMCFM